MVKTCPLVLISIFLFSGSHLIQAFEVSHQTKLDEQSDRIRAKIQRLNPKQKNEDQTPFRNEF